MPPSTSTPLLTGDLEQVIGYLAGHAEETYDPQDPCGCVLHRLLLSLGAPDPLISFDQYYPDASVGPLNEGNYPMPGPLDALQRHWCHYLGSGDRGERMTAEEALTIAINQKDGILTSSPLEAEREYLGDTDDGGYGDDDPEEDPDILW